jgi:hypothetical protein
VEELGFRVWNASKQTDPKNELYNLRYSCLNRDRFEKTRIKRKREKCMGCC